LIDDERVRGCANGKKGRDRTRRIAVRLEMVTGWFAGPNDAPVFVGITVYEPFARPVRL